LKRVLGPSSKSWRVGELEALRSEVRAKVEELESLKARLTT